MDINTVLWVAGFVIAGYGFWLIDWKTKTENDIKKLKESLDAHFKESDLYRANVTHDIHKLELDLSTRITRDELKNDFTDFKKEMREMIRGILIKD